MNRLLLTLLVVLAAANAGCSTADRRLLFREQGTAPHDPPRGRALFEQIPAWDDAAFRKCAGHLPREQMRPGQTRSC